jgi:uncharacterized protein YbaR (Trm112 family)
MHLLLTDRLTCPRCGPTFGLILRADRLESRIVLEGVLGCPNCRDSFSVVDGFGDLRAPPRGELDPGLVGAPEPPAEGADSLLALLGVVAGPGAIVLVGAPARLACAVASALEDVQVVAVDADLRRWPEVPGVSRLVAGPGLPFFSSTARAVAVDGRMGPAWVSEAARIAAARARVVVTHAPVATAQNLLEKGLRVLASEAETVVATRT